MFTLLKWKLEIRVKQVFKQSLFEFILNNFLLSVLLTQVITNNLTQYKLMKRIMQKKNFCANKIISLHKNSAAL